MMLVCCLAPAIIAEQLKSEAARVTTNEYLSLMALRGGGRGNCVPVRSNLEPAVGSIIYGPIY